MASVAVGHPSAPADTAKIPHSCIQVGGSSRKEQGTMLNSSSTLNMCLPSEEQCSGLLSRKENYRVPSNSCSRVFSIKQALEVLNIHNDETKSMRSHSIDPPQSDEGDSQPFECDHESAESVNWTENHEISVTTSKSSQRLGEPLKSSKKAARSDLTAPKAKPGADSNLVPNSSLRGDTCSSAGSSSTVLQHHKALHAHPISPKFSRKSTIKSPAGSNTSPGFSSTASKSPGYVPGYHTARRAELRAMVEKLKTEQDEDLARKGCSSISPREHDTKSPGNSNKFESIFTSSTISEDSEKYECPIDLRRSSKKLQVNSAKKPDSKQDTTYNVESDYGKMIGAKPVKLRVNKQSQKGSAISSEAKSEKATYTNRKPAAFSPNANNADNQQLLETPVNSDVIQNIHSSNEQISTSPIYASYVKEPHTPQPVKSIAVMPANSHQPYIQGLENSEIYGANLDNRASLEAFDHQMVEIQNSRGAESGQNVERHHSVPCSPWNIESHLYPQPMLDYVGNTKNALPLPMHQSIGNLFCGNFDPNMRSVHSTTATLPGLGRPRRGWRRGRQFAQRQNYGSASLPYLGNPFFPHRAPRNNVEYEFEDSENFRSSAHNPLNPEAATYVPSHETRSKFPNTPEKYGAQRGHSKMVDSLLSTGRKNSKRNNVRISSHLKQGHLVILNTQSGHTFKSYYCPENKRVNCKLANLEPNLFATTQTIDWDKFACEVFGSGAKESFNRVHDPGKDLMFLTRSGTCVHTTTYARALVNICVDYSGRRFAIVEFSD